MSIASHNRTPPILVSASRVRPLRPFFGLVFGSAGPAIVLCPIIIFLFSTSSISTSSWIANGSRPGGRANRSGRREAETTGEGKTSVRSVQGRKSLGRRTGWALLGWSSRSARERRGERSEEVRNHQSSASEEEAISLPRLGARVAEGRALSSPPTPLLSVCPSPVPLRSCDGAINIGHRDSRAGLNCTCILRTIDQSVSHKYPRSNIIIFNLERKRFELSTPGTVKFHNLHGCPPRSPGFRLVNRG